MSRVDTLPASLDAPELGNTLTSLGILDPTQLAYARQKQAVTGESLSQMLIRLGLVSASDLARVLADHHGLPYIGSDEWPESDPGVVALFTRDACLSHGLLPLRVHAGHLEAVVGNADPQRAQSLIQRRSGLPARLWQGDFSAVARRIETLYSANQRTVLSEFEREYRQVRQDTQGSFPVNQLINHMLALAVSERATDIHLQPEPQSLHMAFRIDGVLVPIIALDRGMMRLVAAIKVIAAMDISDNLRPQDGRFSVTIDNQTYDIRASTSITPQGESVVLRLLPKGVSVAGLEELGFAPEHLQRLQALFQQPHGIFLMTGPTGSGKTTTLHAGLRPLGMTGKSILTVEDPIEYELPVASQTQVNRKANYTFDTAIRHFLRHDPDIMLVGEIRDAETAEAAIRAAETGHLVLSTLHVNSVSGVVGRLMALGIAPQALAETLIGCINQRLARCLCPQCKTPAATPNAIPAGLDALLAGVQHMRGEGCDYCRHTGFHGRVPVYEMLVFDAPLARWVEEGGSRARLEGLLTEANHVPVWDTGARLVREGLTTVDELVRVFGTRDALASASLRG
ncbi:type II/IV secretion system protein [Pseudomonas neustonica]|uniref:Type II/IV secretion system protein n=1 Tax=Pseudomonas neustonica TaxID=2487346 RepID=A0ABX9XMU7_9PSED|nr:MULTISPECIES: GspE/PulE family protein [Pseudomonas]ROZ84512.1 type II/IV secretion system protein [Pseudomonas sp. SSM44]ROZ86315.1 type II/IV secretion system protein [Pseudomonas neustonica]|tara:strand:- start:1244 stop:2950 length:1707 start_codon:yes stop_codon:yes gene_type:complete